ncbi:uncharacterized protein LOC62_04G006294 [Vanrija pseudolonga]|uniref:DUF1275 domain protein n=1 Tax=Vanrija pseudolonga TaxID=143232 RepID=A0AAF0YFX8_9TREE|nr:hypothetical protein LOC62_04G006294 [Vanrija pseudolonga]
MSCSEAVMPTRATSPTSPTSPPIHAHDCTCAIEHDRRISFERRLSRESLGKGATLAAIMTGRAVRSVDSSPVIAPDAVSPLRARAYSLGPAAIVEEEAEGKVSADVDITQRAASASTAGMSEKASEPDTTPPTSPPTKPRDLEAARPAHPLDYKLSRESWADWSAQDVASTALVPALVMQALATGLLDATTYADFHTFASNQTGNAIVLTVAAVGVLRIQVVLTSVSLASFLFCAFVFGHIGLWLGVRRRAWLLLTTAIQMVFLIVAAVLLSPSGPPGTALKGPAEAATLALFAGMSGAQVAMARQSSCAELPTAPMTSTFVDFVADQYLFAAWGDPKAGPRNRRIFYVLSMLGGSFIGAVMHRWTASWIVVAVAVGLKALVMVLIAFARADTYKPKE